MDALAGAPDGMTSAQIGRSVDLPQATAYRTAQRLVEIGYLKLLPDGKIYALGDRFLALAAAAARHVDTGAVTMALLKQLADDTGMTAYIAVNAGRRIVLTHVRVPSNAVGPSAASGSVYPSHATAGGRAILAFRPAAEIAELFAESELKEFSPSTISSFDALTASLETTRQAGYATMDDELATGTWAIACPIRDGEIVERSLGLVTLGALIGDRSPIDRVLPPLRALARDLETPHTGLQWPVTVVQRR